MPRTSHQRCSGDSTNEGSNAVLSDFESADFACDSPSTAEIEQDAQFVEEPAEEEASQWNHYAADTGQSTVDVDTDASPPSMDDRMLANAIESSSTLLNQLVDQFRELSHLVASHPSPSSSRADQSNRDADICEFRQQISELKAQLAEMRQQNEELLAGPTKCSRVGIEG